MNDCISISYILSSYITLTRTCNQNCAYCCFRQDDSPLLEPDEISAELKKLSEQGITEVVFASGENPSEYPHILIQLAKFGFSAFAEYVNFAIKEALSLNIMPVLEIGSLDTFTLERFYRSGCSIRANLVTAELSDTNEALHDSKTKSPNNGKAFIEALHKNQIPYTICFYVGIGESEEQRLAYIKEIGQLCTADPFLQDIRIVPFQPQCGCKMNERPPLPFAAIAKVFEAARDAFPVHHISIPANLFYRYPELVEHGLNDIGSLPVMSGDIMHPTFEVPNVENIKARLREKNYHLYERGTLSTPAALNRPESYTAVCNSRTVIEKRNSSLISLVDNGHCFVCGNKNPMGLHIPVKEYIKENTVSFTWTPGPNHQSYAGIVHGGILATLLDESMGYAIMGQDLKTKVVTMEYKLTYRHPTPVGIPLKVVATLVGKKHRIIMGRASILAPDGTTLVEATGTFYEIIDKNSTLKEEKQ